MGRNAGMRTYYDREEKQIRHRSKYLGKNVDGMVVKMRLDILSTLPHSSYDWGGIHPSSQHYKGIAYR